MKHILIILCLLSATTSFAQTRLIIVGDVKDATTNEPLAYATIGARNALDQTMSNADGHFELSIPSAFHNDTLVVTYVGYEKFEKPVKQLASIEHVFLKPSVTVLEEVRVVHHPLDLRQVDQNVRLIRDNIYAFQHEVTNAEYNNFLAWLEDYNKADQRKRYDFHLDGYRKSEREFFQQYHKPSPGKVSRKDPTQRFDNYPAVNVTHEDAVAYCNWLTERYNENEKRKKFKKVVFRLPTLKEWQIAALGNTRFQSWDLLQNTVETTIPKDTLEFTKGERKTLSVSGDDILYPWYKFYHMRNRAYNVKGCYMGNFRVDREEPLTCPAHPRGFDGFTMMAPVQCYFPNDFWLFDVVGNVAEMIDEKGKACGGSWNDPPKESTIHSIKTFSGADQTVGFRVFMEVVEK